MYLPTSHGFDSYLGIPFSQDMGLSYWFFCNGPPQADGKPPACDPPIHEPYQPSPIPLLANQTVVDQPAGLYTLAARYSAAATGFIESSAAAAEPFLLCPPPRHRCPDPGLTEILA
jgi:arylsulfatase A